MYKDIDHYYELHSLFYDLTRWAFLFGRSGLSRLLPELPAQAKILDLGCGTGKHLKDLQLKYPEAEITAVDRSFEMIQKAREKTSGNIHFLNREYQKDLFPDNTFDLILCSYSLTMMEDHQKPLEHIKKHLKKDGLLFVLDFDRSASGWFNWWMDKNFVRMSDGLFPSLLGSFRKEKYQTKAAYLGLWQYSLFIGGVK